MDELSTYEKRKYLEKKIEKLEKDIYDISNNKGFVIIWISVILGVLFWIPFLFVIWGGIIIMNNEKKKELIKRRIRKLEDELDDLD